MVIILGIDPGTATTGYGVLRVNGKGLEPINFGLIETSSDGATGGRLITIYDEIVKLIIKHSPTVVVMEKVFFATNRKTAIKVGQAQGAMLMAAAKCKVEMHEYAPGTIKKVVAGSGKADKKQIQQALRRLLGASVRSKPKKRTHFDNAADGLAVAVCHAKMLGLYVDKTSNLEGGGTK